MNLYAHSKLERHHQIGLVFVMRDRHSEKLQQKLGRRARYALDLVEAGIADSYWLDDACG